MNCGDFVIVVNAAKVAVTGKRLDQKIYYRHSQYPGGLKQETLRQVLDKHPERAIERAVKGMLPHNRLGADIRGRLKVYGGPDHPHQAQQPILGAPTADDMLANRSRPPPLRPSRRPHVHTCPDTTTSTTAHLEEQTLAETRAVTSTARGGARPPWPVCACTPTATGVSSSTARDANNTLAA